MAQSTDEINSAIQFNFSNPGARSLAMGGAFTARADDATAVFANPAGLTQLSRMEFSLEGRGWHLSQDFLDSGAIGVSGPKLDLSNAEYNQTNDNVAGLSFASFMYPAKSGRWTVGGYRHETVNYQTQVRSAGTVLPGGFVRPLSAALDLEIQTYGVSLAGKIFGSRDEPRALSVGGTLAYSSFNLASRTERLDALRGTEDPSPESLDESTGFWTEASDGCCQFEDRGDVRFYETQHGDDHGVGYALGILWNDEHYSIGAVYRRAPEFGFSGNSYARTIQLPSTRVFASEGPWKAVFRVPDVWGVGATFRPSDSWVISADFSRISYSSLIRQNLDITGKDRNVNGTGCTPGSSFTCQGLVGQARDFALDDGSEYRLGVEYAISGANRKAAFIRGGAWLDPDHEIRYEGSAPDQRALFQRGDDELHASAGFGIRLRSFQLDLGVDISERVSTVALSGIIWLGKDE
jgi:hypothetical protein